MKVPTEDPVCPEPAEPAGIHVRPPDTPWTTATRALELLRHRGVRRFALGLLVVLGIALSFAAHWDLRSTVEAESSRKAVAGVAEQVASLSERVTELASTVDDIGESVDAMDRDAAVQANKTLNLEVRMDALERDMRDLRSARWDRWDRVMETYDDRQEARPRPRPR